MTEGTFYITKKDHNGGVVYAEQVIGFIDEGVGYDHRNGCWYITDIETGVAISNGYLNIKAAQKELPDLMARLIECKKDPNNEKMIKICKRAIHDMDKAIKIDPSIEQSEHGGSFVNGDDDAPGRFSNGRYS